MACNVFGNAITNETLSELPKYQDKTISRLDRAREAYKMKNAEGKDIKARNYVEGLCKDWVAFVEKERKDATFRQKRCYLVLIYNATGDTITYVNYHNIGGIIGKSPYPYSIENGQWGAFLHVQQINCDDGCGGMAAYRGMNEAGTEIDWMVGWINAPAENFVNCMIYGEVREKDHFKDGNTWAAVINKMRNAFSSNFRDEPSTGQAGHGGVIQVASGCHAYPICDTIITLQNVIGINNV